MRPALSLAAIFALAALAAPAHISQTADPIARVFHPAAPLISYEVATIKPAESDIAPGRSRPTSQTVREYIRTAYAPTFVELAPSQVVGGPDWIDKERFVIQGKAPAEIEAAMQKMNNADRAPQQHSMEQSLLADRFHLKVHYEVREMPVYALEPGKGGLKIKQVAGPAPRDPSAPPPPPIAAGQPLRAGVMFTSVDATGVRTVNAHATTISGVMRLLSAQLGDTGNRPIIDRTGFTGYFDIADMKWAPIGAADSSDSSVASSFVTALEETLGIKLVSTKGPVEVVVIDSIDHPSEN